MTTVYGVTKFGARLQIERQLEKLENFPQDQIFNASLYLVRTTFHCLQQKFAATKEIQVKTQRWPLFRYPNLLLLNVKLMLLNHFQNWFAVSAQLVSSVLKQQMQWTTPLGLPVKQPYLVLKELHHGKKKPVRVPTEEEWLLQPSLDLSGPKVCIL